MRRVVDPSAEGHDDPEDVASTSPVPPGESDQTSDARFGFGSGCGSGCGVRSDQARENPSGRGPSAQGIGERSKEAPAEVRSRLSPSRINPEEIDEPLTSGSRVSMRDPFTRRTSR